KDSNGTQSFAKVFYLLISRMPSDSCSSYFSYESRFSFGVASFYRNCQKIGLPNIICMRSISICNEHGSLDWSVDCTSHRSYYVIHERCNLMSSCIVSATSETFADPCPGTFKYLEVQYQCKPESVTTARSSSSVVLSTSSTSTTRPPIIIPLTRSTRPTVFTTSFKPYPSTSSQKPTTASTHSPVVILLSTSKPYTTKSTTTTISSFNKEEYCQPVQSRNLSWDWTKAGTEVVQKCPGGTFGEARWRCGINPIQWMPDGPDLSDCSSLWADNLRNRVDGGDSVVNIAAELSVMTHRKPLYGGDVRHASEILHRLVTKMGDKMKDIGDDKQRHQLLQELFESASDVTSNLLDVSSSWKELGARERRNIASTLLEALEQSGWLLASAHNSKFLFHKALHNIFLSVRVLDVWSVSHVTFPSEEETKDTAWKQVQDSLHLPMQALLGTVSNGAVKIVLASYKHVKDFLGNVASSNRGILQNSSSIINSRVISAFTGSYTGIKFPEPVTITFKIIQEENVTNPQCVYWDLNARLWSQEGCWLKKSNKTHAVCKCDHLTNFALLMELKTPKESSDNGAYSKLIVFISCGLAIVFFLITAILLHVFRSLPTDDATIHKHLCICLLLSEVVYMGSTDQNGIVCSILAGILHILLQSVFMWIFLSTFQLYLLLVENVYNSRVRYFFVFSYGLSVLIVCISALVNIQSYGTQNYCFLRFDNYYIFSFVGPAASCILGAFIFLILTICKTCWSSMKNKEISKVNSVRIRNRESWLVIFSIGSSWAFLLFYMVQKLPILAYIFAALNCLQGLSVFIFLGLHDNEVQKAYCKWKAGSSPQPKAARGQFPLSNTSSSHNVETPYLQPSTTVSTLSTVTTPELEFQMGTFHHSELCHTTRSPIYDNREQLVS
ncbi:adhesion G protein-coupled receptor L1, partial [Caerostris extrusa]